MRFILGLILVGLLAYFSPMILPWWSIAPLAGLVGFIVGGKWWQSLLYGLLSGAAVWGMSAFSINQANEGILSGQMADLLNIDGGALLVIITMAFGAILAGLGSLSGSLLRDGILPVGVEKSKKSKRSSSWERNRKRRKSWG